MVYKKDSQYDKALVDYAKAIKMEPKNHTAYYNRAELLRDMDRLEESAKDAIKAAELKPDDKDYFNLKLKLGGSFLAKGKGYISKDMTKMDTKKAIVEYTKAIDLNPKHPTTSIAYFARALMQENLNNFKKAIADYTKAIEINPQEPEFYAARGTLYSKLGKKKESYADSEFYQNLVIR